MINKIVFFPGKFHPPHLGHAKTILTLISQYKNVVVGVSGDTPSDKITDVDNIYNILTDLFSPFNSVVVVKITGILVDKSDLTGLPVFDVLASGNPKVLAWVEHMGLEGKYTERAEGYLFSGTEIRKELLDKEGYNI